MPYSLRVVKKDRHATGNLASVWEFDQISTYNSFILLATVGQCPRFFNDIANILLLIATVVFVSLRSGK